MNKARPLTLGALILLASCSGRADPSEANAPLVIDGLCADAQSINAEGIASHDGARPIGDLARYSTPIWIEEPRVFVRANAMWSGDDHRNVIGTIAGQRWVLGDGPLEDAEVGAGIGYAIVVVDPSNTQCRGYLSITVASPTG